MACRYGRARKAYGFAPRPRGAGTDTIVPPRSPSKPALRMRRRHTSLDNCTTHGALAARKTWRLARPTPTIWCHSGAPSGAAQNHRVAVFTGRMDPLDFHGWVQTNERLLFLNIRGLGHFSGHGKFAPIGAGHEDCAQWVRFAKMRGRKHSQYA
jgi:hypothetical protein